MTIDLDTAYTGNLTNEKDVDYYKFSLSEKSKVWIDFSHDKTNQNSFLWQISLFDDSDGSLLDFNSTGENAKQTSNSVRLPAGNYYIRIEDYSYWSDLDYTFCVHSQSEGVDTENENNNDYGTATTIAIGSSIIGNIQSEKDIDFYKFDLPSNASIKLTFTHNLIDARNIFWKFELYSADSGDAIMNDEDKKTIEIRGDSPENISSTWNALPTGTYYLKVYPIYYNNTDYKVTVSN